MFRWRSFEKLNQKSKEVREIRVKTPLKPETD